MKTHSLLLVASIIFCSQTAMGDTPIFGGRYAQGASVDASSQDRFQGDASTRKPLAGIFQRFDENRKTIRISDVDYDLDPALAKLISRFREFRNGQTVLFTQGGISDAGRNVVTTIEPQ